MDSSFVKLEPKLEPGLGASPSAFSEEDIYEDAGDLEFNTEDNYQRLYLARVPNYVWEAWSKLDDDAEIQIGTIRRTVITGPNGDEKPSLTMLLSDNIAEHQTVPKEYELDMTGDNVQNTFIFTEKDLPGFKSKSRQKFDPTMANMPSRLNRPKAEKPLTKTPYDPNKRFQPYYRKAIPKRTTIAGKVHHEVNCIAVANAESERLLAQRTTEAMKPKAKTIFLGNADITNNNAGFIQPGSVAAQMKWDDFIKKSGPAAGKRPQLQKAARIPQNELLDKIFDCFKEYSYWSMKAFRERLKQPEAYLKETLERVAILHRSGSFATQWSLKPENKITNYEDLGDTMAPIMEGEGGDEFEFGEDDEDDDADMKFEDVA